MEWIWFCREKNIFTCIYYQKTFFTLVLKCFAAFSLLVIPVVILSLRLLVLMASHAFGVSSYFLWTQKGLTTLPLVRGSGFVVPFRQMNGFYKYHVITAAHVSCPVRYPQLFSSASDNNPLKAIGERHISNRILFSHASESSFSTINGPFSPCLRHVSSHNLRFQQHFMPNVDVAALRIENEEIFSHDYPKSKLLEVDLTPLQDGEEIVLCGMDAKEAAGNPNDDGLQLLPCELTAVCKAALISVDYGTVLLCEVPEFHRANDREENLINLSHQNSIFASLPAGLCGGPVLRKSNQKAVGVIVARVTRYLPPKDLNKPLNIHEPFLDISDNKEILSQWPLDAAFVPFSEFEGSMRRTED